MTFVFQRGSTTATCRAHRSPVGASCEFLLAFWEAGELQQDVVLIMVFLRGAIVATCGAHRSPVGASCEFLGALLEAGELQKDVILILFFCVGMLRSSKEMSF